MRGVAISKNHYRKTQGLSDASVNPHPWLRTHAGCTATSTRAGLWPQTQGCLSSQSGSTQRASRGCLSRSQGIQGPTVVASFSIPYFPFLCLQLLIIPLHLLIISLSFFVCMSLGTRASCIYIYIYIYINYIYTYIYI